MKFDDKCEKLLKKYTLNEGIGDTLKKAVVDPFIDLNPWISPEKKAALKYRDKKDAKDELNGTSNQIGKNTQSEYGINVQQLLSDYRNNQLRSNVITAKEISLVNKGTVIGKFRLNCPDILKGRVTYNNLLLTDASATPDQIQKGLQFISSFDLRRFNLMDSIVDKELSTLIRNELLKAKADPATVGSKVTGILKEIKDDITNIFGPYDLRSHPNIFMKVIWFFIFYKQNQLKN